MLRNILNLFVILLFIFPFFLNLKVYAQSYSSYYGEDDKKTINEAITLVENAYLYNSSYIRHVPE
jgi:hypothetical protein